MHHGKEIKNPLHPIFAVLGAIVLFVFGLLNSKNVYTGYFFIGIYVMYFFIGYHRQALIILPIFLISAFIFLGITYLASKDTKELIYASIRLSAFFIGLIPNLGIKSIDLIRSMRELRVSKKIVLGFMIIFSFFHVLQKEQRLIKQAMKTRGAGSLISPKIFYRAYFIPFVTRILTISETLSTSIETRGFDLTKSEETVYNPPKVKVKDFIYVILIVIGMGLVIFL